MPDPAISWQQVSALVAQRLGLHFPRDRLGELQRGLDSAAGELRLADAGECARQLVAAQLDDAQVEVVASHLTIGETYFFRGEETFAALAAHVLPALTAARRRGDKRLRMWSAGCCSGEEPYSLAILLRQLLPDIDDWRISILATDINPRFLRKASDAVYGAWSFRGTSGEFRERYFRRADDGRYALVPEIKRMVTFAPLNLVDSAPAIPAAATGAMDLILCRNVLMYFTADQAAAVAARLHRSLREDGWLVVAPCEVSQPLFARFTPHTFDGAILYRRRSAASAEARCGRALPAASTSAASVPAAAPAITASPPAGPRRRARLRGPRMAWVPAVGCRPEPAPASSAGPDVRALSARAHRLANEGRLGEALACCDQWVACDRLDAGAHYLRAMVLIELGEMAQANAALQRSIYLEPDAAMTCFALGNLERRLGRRQAAMRHFQHALALLQRQPPEAGVVLSDGITAHQMITLVRQLLDAGDAA